MPTDLLMSILNSFHCWKEARLLFQIERLQLNEKLNNWKLEKKSEKFGSCDCSFCNLQEKKKKKKNESNYNDLKSSNINQFLCIQKKYFSFHLSENKF